MWPRCCRERATASSGSRSSHPSPTPHFAAILGVAVLARLGPRALLSVRTGAMLDRADVRSVLIVIDLMRAVLMVALAAVVGAGGAPSLMLVVVLASYTVGVPTRPGLTVALAYLAGESRLAAANATAQQHPSDDDVRRASHRCAHRVVVAGCGRCAERRVVRGIGGSRGDSTRSLAPRWYRTSQDRDSPPTSPSGTGGRSHPIGGRAGRARLSRRRHVLRPRRGDGASRLCRARHPARPAVRDRVSRRRGGSRRVACDTTRSTCV